MQQLQWSLGISACCSTEVHLAGGNLLVDGRSHLFVSAGDASQRQLYCFRTRSRNDTQERRSVRNVNACNNITVRYTRSLHKLTPRTAALLALGILTSFDPLDILVVFMALTVDGVLHVVVDMTVVVVPSLPCIMVSVRLGRAGQRVLLEGLLVLPQDLALVAVPRLERLLVLLLGGVVLALRPVDTSEEQVARDKSHGVVEVASGEVRDVVAAGVHWFVVTTSIEVVVIGTSPNNSAVSMRRRSSE